MPEVEGEIKLWRDEVKEGAREELKGHKRKTAKEGKRERVSAVRTSEVAECDGNLSAAAAMTGLGGRSISERRRGGAANTLFFSSPVPAVHPTHLSICPSVHEKGGGVGGGVLRQWTDARQRGGMQAVMMDGSRQRWGNGGAKWRDYTCVRVCVCSCTYIQLQRLMNTWYQHVINM